MSVQDSVKGPLVAWRQAKAECQNSQLPLSTATTIGKASVEKSGQPGPVVPHDKLDTLMQWFRQYSSGRYLARVDGFKSHLKAIEGHYKEHMTEWLGGEACGRCPDGIGEEACLSCSLCTERTACSEFTPGLSRVTLHHNHESSTIRLDGPRQLAFPLRRFQNACEFCIHPHVLPLIALDIKSLKSPTCLQPT